jgi:hypothetical protein
VPKKAAPAKAAAPAPAPKAPAKVATGAATDPIPVVIDEDEDDQGEKLVDEIDGEALGKVETAASVPVQIPDNIRNASKIRDVLNALIAGGYNTTDKLVNECLRIQPEVPILAKVPDLRERVQRAAEILGVEAS